MSWNDNVTINRYEFWSHNQEEGQSLDDYIKELTILRKECRFQEDEHIEDSLLRDRIILYGIQNKSLREKLLRLDSQNSDLKTVISVCRSHEISQHHSSMIGESTNVHAIRRSPTQPSTRMTNMANDNYGRRAPAQKNQQIR